MTYLCSRFSNESCWNNRFTAG